MTDEAPQDIRHKNHDERPREAYFNGSAFLKLSSFVSVHRHSGLSFRTCEGGRLFAQKYDEDSISLEVTPDGLLFAAIVEQQRYKARLNARLLNNAWHNVNLFFRLGNLTLNAAGHTQVIIFFQTPLFLTDRFILLDSIVRNFSYLLNSGDRQRDLQRCHSHVARLRYEWLPRRGRRIQRMYPAGPGNSF